MNISLKNNSKEGIIQFLNKLSKLDNDDIVSSLNNSDLTLVKFLINLKETNLYPISKELTLEIFKTDFFDPTSIFSHALIGFIETFEIKIPFMSNYKEFLDKWIELNPEKSKIQLPFFFNISMQTFIKEEIQDIISEHLEKNNQIPFEYLKKDKNPKDYYKFNLNYLERIDKNIRESKNISDLSLNLFGKNSKSLRKIISQYILINNDINYDFFLLAKISKELNLDVNIIQRFYTNYDFQYFYNKNKYSYICSSPKVLDFLIKNFPKKIIKIINSTIENRHVTEMEEFLNHSKEISYTLPENPKTFTEIHNFLNYQYRIKEQPNHSLNQENISLWENETINSEGIEYQIFVPKTNHDLIYSGFKMMNCVGDGEYAPDLEKGNHKIFFLKEKNNFKVCVFLDKNKLNSAKGKRNTQISPMLMLDIKKFLLKKEN